MTERPIDHSQGITEFRSVFGADPSHVAHAPGRINLIGEHIDYCGGLVMPMTIKQETRGYYRFTGRSEVRVFSGRFNQLNVINPLDVMSLASGVWGDYVRGLLRIGTHRQLGRGFDLWLTSDLSGGGLSSSASLLALLALVNHHALSNQIVDDSNASFRLTLALLCQQVENNFVGVPSGVMDPVSILMGGLIKLDCQTLKFERLRSIPETHCLVVMDTGVPRTLAASGYAERVAEIEQIEALNPAIANRQRLAQLDAQTADLVLENLDAPVLKARACHIFTEQTRVEKSALALADRDLVQLGHLMNESHRSLSKDYQVSCDALDHITQISRDSGYALGARMTGAGFGGCAIALVPKVDADRHNAAVEEAYQLHTGLKPALLVAEPGGSAHIVAI